MKGTSISKQKIWIDRRLYENKRDECSNLSRKKIDERTMGIPRKIYSNLQATAAIASTPSPFTIDNILSTKPKSTLGNASIRDSFRSVRLSPEIFSSATMVRCTNNCETSPPTLSDPVSFQLQHQIPTTITTVVNLDQLATLAAASFNSSTSELIGT